MARNFETGIDLLGNEALNMRAQQLAAPPAGPALGLLYFDTTRDAAHQAPYGIYTTDGWLYFGASTGAISQTVVDAKGDLIAGTANDTVARKAVGADGTLLVADSAQTTGLTWRVLADADIPAAIARDAEVDAAYQDRASKGVAGGYASLDGGGRVPASQLPVSAMEYKGSWNATTNTPALADGAGSTGDLYRVSTAGTRNLGSGNITFDVGDYAIYNGATWEKGDTTDAVSSAFGRTGAIVAVDADYTASQVAFTPGHTVAANRVEAAIYEVADEYAAADAAHAAAGDPHTQYARIFAVDCAANVLTNVDHNFGTKDVVVQVHRTAAPYDQVECDVEMNTVNRVIVRWTTAPAAGDFRIVVLG